MRPGEASGLKLTFGLLSDLVYGTSCLSSSPLPESERLRARLLLALSLSPVEGARSPPVVESCEKRQLAPREHTPLAKSRQRPLRPAGPASGCCLPSSCCLRRRPSAALRSLVSLVASADSAIAGGPPRPSRRT